MDIEFQYISIREYGNIGESESGWKPHRKTS